jgi:hypothetical protein
MLFYLRYLRVKTDLHTYEGITFDEKIIFSKKCNFYTPHQIFFSLNIYFSLRYDWEI